LISFSVTFSLTALKSDTLIIPALLSVSSAFLLLVHFTSTRKDTQDEGGCGLPADLGVTRRLVIKLRNHTHILGGLTIFVWRILRLLAIFNLVGLVVATLTLENDGVHDSAHRVRLLDWTTLGAYVCIVSSFHLSGFLTAPQIYASVLALTAVSTPSTIANVANTHLIWVLFGTWVVYVHRDIYPLGTFTLEPLDLHEGWLMWTKFGVLTFAAVVVPLFIPTQYIPFDSKVCLNRSIDT
jgi:hypothetical protein